MVHYRQLHIHGANGSAREHNKRAWEYTASGEVPVTDLVTVRLPLERALDALDIVAKGEAITVIVEPCSATGVTARAPRGSRRW